MNEIFAHLATGATLLLGGTAPRIIRGQWIWGGETLHLHYLQLVSHKRGEIVYTSNHVETADFNKPQGRAVRGMIFGSEPETFKSVGEAVAFLQKQEEFYLSQPSRFAIVPDEVGISSMVKGGNDDKVLIAALSNPIGPKVLTMSPEVAQVRKEQISANRFKRQVRYTA